MKELDILLGSFLDKYQSELDDGKWPELEALLEMEDDLLWDHLRQPDQVETEQFTALINAIRDSQIHRA